MVAAVLLSSQRSSSGCLGPLSALPCSRYHQPALAEKITKHRACERQSREPQELLFHPSPASAISCFPVSTRNLSQLPEQMFVPTSVCAWKTNSSTDNSTWMRPDFHIYVFQTAHSLPFLCVYPLHFLLTGCGLPLAARAQTEINKAASVFEFLSKNP